MPKESAGKRQTFSRHDRLTCGGKAQAAGLRTRADIAPAGREAVRAQAFGVARNQERTGIARIGQRGDVCPRNLAERLYARAGFRIGKVDGDLANIAPAQIERFAAAASRERQ